MPPLENASPVVFAKSTGRRAVTETDYDNNVRDPLDVQEVFDQIRHINDPEHPLTLEQLNVVRLDQISIDSSNNEIQVLYTPTIPHCSMATLIGLSIMIKLQRSFGTGHKYRVAIFPGTHQNEHAITKQLNDKERVSAALENGALLAAINEALTPSVP